MKACFFHFLCIAMFFGCAAKNKSTTPEVNVPAPFEKIIFHTSMCFGTCPVYHMEVDGNKNVKLHAETIFARGVGIQRDSSKIGYFKGTANDTAFDDLTHEIQTLGIDTLNFGNARCCDGSLITIIVYHDGKRKFMQSMFPPARTRNLISALYAICEKSKLEKTEEKFIIEDSEK
ncbi:MAG: DUF6438 domain-containing protein [Bacteroidota bacterium]|nr:DUF6438 domain-containing protein [Bacteroidota bacterium]